MSPRPLLLVEPGDHHRWGCSDIPPAGERCFFQLFFSLKEWQAWGYLSPSATSQIKQGLAASCSPGINNVARFTGKSARAAFQKTWIKATILSWMDVISKWIRWVSGRRTPLKPDRPGCVSLGLWGEGKGGCEAHGVNIKPLLKWLRWS